MRNRETRRTGGAPRLRQQVSRTCHQIIDAAASRALNVHALATPEAEDRQAARDALAALDRIVQLARDLRAAAERSNSLPRP